MPSLGLRSSRSPVAPTNCACIAPRWDGRSSATASMEAPRGRAPLTLTCTHARSSCRSTRIARRYASARPYRRTCTTCCARADGRGMWPRNDRDIAAARSAPRSVQRRLQALGCGTVVGLAAEIASGQLGENRAVARRAVAVHVTRWIPQLRANDRLRALIEDAVDGHDEHRARRLLVYCKARTQRRIGRDCGAAVDANGLAAARNEEEQRHARVRKDIAQAVDAVIAAPVGNQQRLLVLNAHESGRIAARGTIKAVGPRRGQREERRRLDEGAIMWGDAVGLLGNRRPIGLAVDALQRLDG